MKFSICIPNYNYARYLGRTIQSIKDQTDGDLEILVSDNASTDRSVDVVRAIGDPRIRLHVNACNVGFGGNLDRAARLASGELMVMLSSDDLMRPDALATYRKLYDALGDEGPRSVATATWDVIDPNDAVTGRTGPDPAIWKQSDRVPHLEAIVDAPVYGVAGDELLRRSVRAMKNPFNFAATIYPRALYEAIEGYGGGRLINPDRWFNWKLLTVSSRAYFIDKPLFAYRVHGANQGAQQAASGALKYLVDEYVSTFELDAKVLARVGLERADVERAFIEYDIGRHGLAALAKVGARQGRRIYHFGKAVYPQHAKRNFKVRMLGLLSALGPIGERIARIAYRRAMQAQTTRS